MWWLRNHVFSGDVWQPVLPPPVQSPGRGPYPPESPVSHTSLSENSLWLSLGLQTLYPWGQAGCEGAALTPPQTNCLPSAEHLCTSGMWVPGPGACQCKGKVHWWQERCFPFSWGLRFLKHESSSNCLRSEAHSWGAPLVQGGASRTKLSCRMLFLEPSLPGKGIFAFQEQGSQSWQWHGDTQKDPRMPRRAGTLNLLLALSLCRNAALESITSGFKGLRM